MMKAPVTQRMGLVIWYMRGEMGSLRDTGTKWKYQYRNKFNGWIKLLFFSKEDDNTTTAIKINKIKRKFLTGIFTASISQNWFCSQLFCLISMIGAIYQWQKQIITNMDVAWRLERFCSDDQTLFYR